VLVNISVGGAIERAINFDDKVIMLSENGAKVVNVTIYTLESMGLELIANLGGNAEKGKNCTLASTI
jgi:ATP-dependent Lon protease